MFDKEHSANQLNIASIKSVVCQDGSLVRVHLRIRQSARFDVSNKQLTNQDTWLVLETARPMFGVAELMAGSKNICMFYGLVQLRLLRGQQEVRMRCQTTISLNGDSYKGLHTRS